jgi:aspartyl/asparaginyl beta-hydroxylase (cupin superfamily)
MWYKIQSFIGKSIISYTEYVIRTFVKNEVIIDKQQFAWIKNIEDNFEAIKREFLQVSGNENTLLDVTKFSEEQKQVVIANQWSVFLFKIYNTEVTENIEKCPVTYQCIQQIPDCTTAFFSIMKPDTEVAAHRGAYKGYLRYHLGITVPEDVTECGLEFNNQVYHWKEGESVVFDDTFEHSVYNRSAVSRAVLYIDFIRPMPGLLVWFSRLLTKSINKSLYVQNMQIK